MLKVNTYSIKGTKLTPVSLPKEFGAKVNLPLLAQAIRVYEERSHIGLAKTKTRAEINRTKKKWYRQKGTGGARHGARSAPIFVGGGVAHGPKPVRRELKLPDKMRKMALSVALSLKAKEGQIAAVDGLAKITKTNAVATLIKKFKEAKKFTFILSEKNLAVRKFLRNLENVGAVPYKNLNAYQVFFGGTLIFDREIFTKQKKQ